LGGRRQQGPIGGGKGGSRSSSTEDLHLVAEHGRLELRLIDAAADEQTEQAADEPVPQGEEHLGQV
jgi:hypothetical protein